MKKTMLALLMASALLFSACKASPAQALEAALGTLQVVAVADGANLGLSPVEIKQVITVTNGVENIIQAQKLGWATGGLQRSLCNGSPLMEAFWKHVGLAFATVGKGAASVAVWASKHPQVIEAVVAASGNAQAIKIASTVVPVISSL